MNKVDTTKISSTKNRRIELLFQQSISSGYASIRGSLVVLALLYLETHNFSYFIWVAGTLFASALRIFFASAFRKNNVKKEDYNKWLNYHLFSSTLTGISWGLLIFIDISNLSTIYQSFTFLALAFVCIGAISSYSYITMSFFLFTVSLTIVFIIGILITLGISYYPLILLFLLLLPTLIITSRQFNSNLVESLTQQLEVENLLSELKLNHEQLEEKIFLRTLDLVKAKEDAENANQAKSDFLTNMTHELRTPLHAILSFSKLGSKKKTTITTDKIAGYCEKIHHSGVRLLELTDNLLELSRLDSGKVEFIIEKTSIGNILESAVSEFESLFMDKSIQLEVNKPHEETKLMMDQNRIGQVIKNLLGNAIKFSPENGTIGISIQQENMVIGRRDTDEETQPAIKFSISDEGVGIPEDELSLIFEKFIQSSSTKTGAGGTGLGLAICKEVVDAHGGKIWAENNPDKGSCFHFIIPEPTN